MLLTGFATMQRSQLASQFSQNRFVQTCAAQNHVAECDCGRFIRKPSTGNLKIAGHLMDTGRHALASQKGTQASCRLLHLTGIRVQNGYLEFRHVALPFRTLHLAVNMPLRFQSSHGSVRHGSGYLPVLLSANIARGVDSGN